MRHTTHEHPALRPLAAVGNWPYVALSGIGRRSTPRDREPNTINSLQFIFRAVEPAADPWPWAHDPQAAALEVEVMWAEWAHPLARLDRHDGAKKYMCDALAGVEMLRLPDGDRPLQGARPGATRDEVVATLQRQLQLRSQFAAAIASSSDPVPLTFPVNGEAVAFQAYVLDGYFGAWAMYRGSAVTVFSRHVAPQDVALEDLRSLAGVTGLDRDGAQIEELLAR